MNKTLFNRDKFLGIISQYSEAKSLLETLENNGDLFLFGGAVREYFDNEYNRMPRDFDLVFQKKDKNIDLDKIMKNFTYTKNRFNGYKIHFDNLEFDVWNLEDTWAFKEKKMDTNNLDYSENLQNTVFLNIDSIVYNLTKEKLYGDEYFKAMNNRELDIVLDETPFIELNLLRALVFKQKYNMKFSDNLNHKFYDFFESQKKVAINNLYQVQMKHYKREIFTKDELREELKLIISLKDYNISKM